MIAITDRKRLFLSTIFIFAIFLASCNKSNNSSSSDNNLVGDAVGGIAAALTSGDSYRCQYSNSEDNSSGVYLVKNKKFRADGQEGTDGKPSSIIFNEQGMYIWSPGESQGFFYPVSDEDTKDQNSQPDQPSQFNDFLNPENLDEKEDIDCQKAAVDDSQFVPPADVSFQNFSEIMQNFENPDMENSIPEFNLDDLPVVGQ